MSGPVKASPRGPGGDKSLSAKQALLFSQKLHIFFFFKNVMDVNETHKFVNGKKKDIDSEKENKHPADKDLSSWTGLDRSGHVRMTSFNQISHVSDPTLTF